MLVPLSLSTDMCMCLWIEVCEAEECAEESHNACSAGILLLISCLADRKGRVEMNDFVSWVGGGSDYLVYCQVR